VLNPELIKHLGTDRFFRVYADALKGFKRDEFYKISNRNLRLIRRMIRDYARRGNSPETTMKSWRNVCDAEDTYIAPFKDSADAFINTTHDFELALYKTDFFEIVMENREVIQELPFLEIFEDSISLDKRRIPDTSLMWEFVDKQEDEDAKDDKKSQAK
jgi:uridine kinase